MMNLHIAHQQLAETANQSLITFESEYGTGQPLSISLEAGQEDAVQLELAIDDEQPAFHQDPLIAEALRLFQAEIA